MVVYVVHLAYQPAEEMNAYCEIPDKVFGVWSPRMGEESRICTRLVKWTIRAKSKAATEAKSCPGLGYGLLPSPTGDAWSSVNNSTEDEKIIDFSPKVEEVTDDSDEEIGDFENMDAATRRRLIRRLRSTPVRRVKTDSPYDPGSDLELTCRSSFNARLEKQQTEEACVSLLQPAVERVISEGIIQKLSISRGQALSLLLGSKLKVGCKIYRSSPFGLLWIERSNSFDLVVTHLWLRFSTLHGVDSKKFRFDPFGEYLKMLKSIV